MAEFLTLKAQKRELTGKGAARRLRAAGQVPAVFYTAGDVNVPLSINERELSMLYSQVRRTRVFNLEITGGAPGSHPSLIWDIDYFPVKNKIQHVDIFGVDLQKEIKIRIPLEFIGTAKGIKLGGQLEIYREALFIIGKPLELPQKITVDVSNLDINDVIRVKDLPLASGLKADLDAEISLVAVLTVSETADQEETSGTDAAPAAE